MNENRLKISVDCSRIGLFAPIFVGSTVKKANYAFCPKRKLSMSKNL